MALMSESIAIGIFLILLFGAASVYLYSRITYNEKRLSMLESLLVDIKMMIESSEQEANAQPVMPVASVYQFTTEPRPMTPVNEMEDESVYAAVLEQANDASGTGLEEAEAEAEVAELSPEVSSKVGPNYDAMTRAELATLAEQRGLRVAKRVGRGEIISMLRKADESNNSATSTGKENAPGALFPADGPVGGDLSLDSGNAGAELDA